MTRPHPRNRRLPDPLLRLDRAGVIMDGHVRLHPATLRLRPQVRADGGTREGADRSADADEREGGRERRQQAARQREALKPLRKAAEREEARCTRLQADLDAVEKALADPALYDQADGGQLAALLQRQGRLRSDLETAEAAWMEALEALENARAEA